ncbi:DUF5011 domain-containing protein [Pseudomonadales bacterium]|nr:DUF5011 domain-containing protein [Pseudomonadales bacterium]
MTYNLVISSEPCVDEDDQCEFPYDPRFYPVKPLRGEFFLAEEIPVGVYALGRNAGLDDGKRYYWKVEAVDRFGARRSSEVRTFRTDNTNEAAGPDLAIQQRVASQYGFTGTPILLTLQVVNNGSQLDEDAQRVTTSTQIPRNARVEQASLPANCLIDDRTVNCELGTMTNGDNRSVSPPIHITPTQQGRISLVTVVNGFLDETKKQQQPDEDFTNNVNSLRFVIRAGGDADNDGLPDSWELENGYNPADPDDAKRDSDNDGRDTLTEFIEGSDPNVADTASNRPPALTLNGSSTISLAIGTAFIDPGATATDAEDGSLTVEVSEIDTSIAGIKTITYTTTDSGGLSATVTRTVVVEATVTPPGTGIPVRLTPGKIIELPVVDQTLSSSAGISQTVPAGATAASLNVTVVNPVAGGFVTVWPCGVTRPLSSNLNFVAGDIVPNGVIASIGSNGSVCFYSSQESDLIVDIAGWFEGTAYTGATPTRLTDTRDGTGGFQGRTGAINPLTIKVTERSVADASGSATTVPTNIGAVALNVTVVSPVSGGFITVWPCDVVRPLSSNVNYVAGQIVANGVIAPVSADGTVCLFSQADTDIVVDLAGWFPLASFTGSTPTRLADTRDGTGGRLGALVSTDELTVQVHGINLTSNGQSVAVPTTATAAAINVTVVNPATSGFITVWPCGVDRPLASNLNFVAGQIVANNVVAPIGNEGSVCVYSSAPADVIVDIAGWFNSSSSGDFIGTTPERFVDTRDGTGPAPK